MKILHVINSLGVGGAEKLVSDLSVIQKQSGNDVVVIALFRVDSFIEKKIEKGGVRVVTVRDKKSDMYNPVILLSLFRIIKKEFADIIHVHLFPAQYWCAIYNMFFSRKEKLITTEHSTNNRRRDKWFLKPIEKIVYSRYNAIIACSEKAENTLSAYLRRKVTFISNGVDTAFYHDAKGYDKYELYSVNDDVVIISMVARFTYPKDHETVIKAISLLSDNIHVVFIGDGELRERCEKLASKLNVANRCHFLGLREDVERLIKSSDINILSSKWEGLSLSSVECMATEKPFIGSNVQGIREIVADAGLLFDYADYKMLADLIMSLVESRDFYNDISSKCYKRSLDYDIKRTGLLYLNLYEKVLNER